MGYSTKGNDIKEWYTFISCSLSLVVDVPKRHSQGILLEKKAEPPSRVLKKYASCIYPLLFFPPVSRVSLLSSTNAAWMEIHNGILDGGLCWNVLPKFFFMTGFIHPFICPSFKYWPALIIWWPPDIWICKRKCSSVFNHFLGWIQHPTYVSL